MSRRIAIELNTSCPNLGYITPSSYAPETLKPLLEVLAKVCYEDETLTVGLKISPFTHAKQFEDLLDVVDSFSRNDAEITCNPFSFLTCTNTLGSSLLFEDQALVHGNAPKSEARSDNPYALPTPLGGLAGEAIHSLSLGNVFAFTNLLKTPRYAALREIKIIGVGGVTSLAAANRMREAGAHVVGCATLLGLEGVAAFELLSGDH